MAYAYKVTIDEFKYTTMYLNSSTLQCTLIQVHNNVLEFKYITMYFNSSTLQCT